MYGQYQTRRLDGGIWLHMDSTTLGDCGVGIWLHRESKILGEWVLGYCYKVNV